MEAIGRTLPRSSKSAFALEPGSTPVARALCLHGFTGTPFEVRPLADALLEHGVASTGVLLPGHGTRPEDMAECTWHQWEQAALDAWDGMPADRPRLLVGSSMGGLLALRVAMKRGDAAALVLLAPALSFFADGELAARASLRGLWRLKPYVDKEDAGGDLADAAARAANPTYAVIPTKPLGQVKLLQRAVRAELSRVSAPLCLFHGAQDHTIPPAASAEIAAGVASAVVEHHRLRDSFHVIGIDVDRERIAAHTVRFLARVVGWAS